VLLPERALPDLQLSHAGRQGQTCHNVRSRAAGARSTVDEASEGLQDVAKARRAKPARRRDKKGGPGSGRRKSCPYCKDKIEQVDYKDVATLRRFVSERGKIRSRRISGACRRHQNQLATAVKRAREIALLPYVSDAREERPERGGRGGGYREREER
jgi:small subunit ribosomal protein S18